MVSFDYRYLIYTRWCILHCDQAKIEAESQALVVPTVRVDTEHDNLCILYWGNGLKLTINPLLCSWIINILNTQMQKSTMFSVAFFWWVGTTNMAAVYCYEGIPLRFLASFFDIQMRYLVYIRYLWFWHVYMQLALLAQVTSLSYWSRRFTLKHDYLYKWSEQKCFFYSQHVVYEAMVQTRVGRLFIRFLNTQWGLKIRRKAEYFSTNLKVSSLRVFELTYFWNKHFARKSSRKLA